MPKLDDQISTLQDRLAQLKLRQQRVEARQRAIAADRERKTETRRRILVGAVVMDKLRRGELEGHPILEWLDQSIARVADRALFDLPPRPTAAEADSKAHEATAQAAAGQSISGEGSRGPDV